MNLLLGAETLSTFGRESELRTFGSAICRICNREQFLWRKSQIKEKHQFQLVPDRNK